MLITEEGKGYWESCKIVILISLTKKTYWGKLHKNFKNLKKSTVCPSKRLVLLVEKTNWGKSPRACPTAV